MVWQYRLFYLIVFLLPTNLARHFVLPSAYVGGTLVDYLVPTVYLTDILIILLLVLWLASSSRLKNRESTVPTSSRGPGLKHPLTVFLLLLLPSVILAASPLPAMYKWFKFFELSLFALWIKRHIELKIHLSSITKTLAFAVLFQSLLALTQWLNQSSAFGFWLFGEQPYTDATLGIDKITWFDGSLKVPPLGTTPHPNVLGGFLAVTLPLILQGLSLKAFKLIASVLGVTALFLTFSLSAWLGFLLIGLPAVFFFGRPTLYPKLRAKQLALIKDLPRFYFWQDQLENPAGANPATNFYRVTKLIAFYAGVLLLLLIFAQNLSFLAPQSSFSRRSQLTQMAVSMIKDSPLTGVGLNNFTVVMDHYGLIPATTRFLQPVHNIYLLMLAETGILGFSGFVWLLFYPLYRAIKQKTITDYRLPITVYLLLLFLGLFDHYPITLQPGLLLLFLLSSLI